MIMFNSLCLFYVDYSNRNIKCFWGIEGKMKCDTKGPIVSRKSTDRQHNDRNKEHKHKH